MKLVYPEWTSQITFSEGGTEIVQIEDPVYFSSVLGELVGQCENDNGRFVLSDGDEILDFSKSAEIILSPFSLDVSSRKISSEIVKSLVKVAYDEKFVETGNITSIILKYLYKLIDYEDINVELNDEVDLQMLFKSAGLKAAIDETSLLTRLTDYIFLIRDLLKVKLFICVNLLSYISEDQFFAFKKTVTAGKISVLLLQSIVKSEMIKNKERLIIDKDLCEI